MSKLLSIYRLLAACYLLIFFIVISIVPINRWHQYEMTYFDHGIYDHALWNASRLNVPLIDHLEAQSINQLGDHLTLLMYLLTPIYWLTSSYTMLFVVQAGIVTASVALLASIAWRKLKNRWAVALIIISTTGFIGLQSAVVGDFHADILGMLPLALMLNSLDKKQWKRFFLWLFIMFLGKESFSIIGLALALYLWFCGEKKISLMVGLFSIVYLFVAIRFLMPWFAGRAYQYTEHMPPLTGAIERFFLPAIKTKTMFVSMLTFGFLPLLAPSFLPVIIQDWVVRFVLNLAGTRFDLGMHYNAMISLLLAYGSILGFDRLLAVKQLRRMLPLFTIGVIVCVIGIHQFWYHGPLGLAFNKAFYTHSKEFVFLDKLIAGVTSKGLIMAPNNLAVRFTHTHNVMLLRQDYSKYQPDFIVLDMRDGQNPNAFWPLTFDQLKNLHQSLIINPNYTMKQTGNEQFIFVKN